MIEIPIAIIGIIGWLLYWQVAKDQRDTIRICNRLLDYLEEWYEKVNKGP